MNAMPKVIEEGPTYAERMAQLFAGAECAYRLLSVVPIAGRKAQKIYDNAARPVTIEDWERHLCGDVGLVVVPVREDGTCLFGAIDIDDYTVSLSDLDDQVGRVLVVCRSTSGGAHLYAFLSRPERAGPLREQLRRIAASIGHPRAEIFPKQDRIDGDNKGSGISLPYFRGNETDRYAVKQGLTKDVAEFLYHAEAKATTVEALSALAASQPGDSGARQTADQSDAEERLRMRCAAIVDAAGADANKQLTAGAFDIARYCRDVGMTEAEARSQMLAAWLMRKPGCEKEFAGVWAREFDAGTRKGSPALKCGGGLPSIERLLIEADDGDVVWHVQIDGTFVSMTVPEAMDQRKFNNCSMAQIGRAFHIVKDRNRWIDHVNEAASRAEYIGLDRGTTAAEEFLDALDEFLMNRHRGENREDLLLGRPWEDEVRGLHFFRIKDLQAHLVTRRLANRFATEPARRVGKRIRELGGEPAEMTIKDKRVSLFCVPATLFTSMPKADIPPIPKEPV